MGLIFWIGIAALTVVTDQATKLLIMSNLDYNQRINVLPVFDLTLRHNRGAAFSLFASQRGWQLYYFIGMAVGVSAIIVGVLYWRVVGYCSSFGLTLVLGGALGNLIDRACYG